MCQRPHGQQESIKGPLSVSNSTVRKHPQSYNHGKGMSSPAVRQQLWTGGEGENSIN